MAATAEQTGTVLASGLQFPEGPAFGPDGALWWVELKGGCVTRLGSDGPQRYQVGGAPNGLAFGPNGLLFFCDAQADAVRVLDPTDGTTSIFVGSTDVQNLTGPNDLAFDRSGRLVFTCPGNSRTEPTGTVWASAGDGKAERIADGLYFPNGLAFSADGQTLFIAETYRHRVWKGQYDTGSGEWSDPVVLAEVGGPNGPDGMAVGSDGALYVAVFGQGAVKRVTPDGQVSVVVTPGERPTNCAFDPQGKLGLVVTEGSEGLLISYAALGTGIPLLGRDHGKS